MYIVYATVPTALLMCAVIIKQLYARIVVYNTLVYNNLSTRLIVFLCIFFLSPTGPVSELLTISYRHVYYHAIIHICIYRAYIICVLHRMYYDCIYASNVNIFQPSLPFLSNTRVGLLFFRFFFGFYTHGNTLWSV